MIFSPSNVRKDFLMVQFPDGGIKCIALAIRRRVLCRWVLCQCSSDGQTLHTGGRSQLLCCCELESGTGRQFVFFSLISTERAVETFLGKNTPRVHLWYKRGLFLGTYTQPANHTFCTRACRYTKQLETSHCSETATISLMCAKSVYNEIAACLFILLNDTLV